MKSKKQTTIQKRTNYQIKKQINWVREQNKKWKKCKAKCNKDCKRLNLKNKSIQMNYKNLMNLLEIKYKELKLIIKKNLMN